MTELNEYYEFRDGLAGAVVRDLVGPARDDEPRPDEEVLREAPMNRYISGILYPPAPDPIDAVQDNDLGDIKDDDRDDGADPPIALANVRYPSAMGLTCGVDTSAVDKVLLTVTTARYLHVDDDGTDDDGDCDPDPGGVDDGGIDDADSDKETAAHGDRWLRTPLEFEHEIVLNRVAHDYRHPLGDGLELFVRERDPDPEGNSALTVALINTLTLPQGEWQRDAHSFFQVEFDLSTAGTASFVDRSKLTTGGVDDDARSFALLYRHSPSFAVGHGCGTSWAASTERPDRATSVRSSVTPSHDLLLADNNPEISSPFFGMRRLAEDPRPEVIEGLEAFVAGYRDWIDDRRSEVAALGEGFGPTARRHLDECDVAVGRIASGIRLLAVDDRVWLAFQLANRAMLVQRARADWATGDKTGTPDLEGDRHQWRAFQIGFILMTLGGIADSDSEEREVVDLLWFPTGGGKTEAYLGLIAFTVFLRRLRKVADGGTGAGMTVIMRYTLRLLTLQQYQRAAILICACESIRRQRDDLGREEISICLWVGKASTPLTLAATRAALEKLRSGASLEENNPVQLRECPWCATKLSHRNYWVADYKPRLVIACRNEDCEFEKGLPCYLFDEDVYNLRPTLMIATVDKFASMPWRDKIGPLFNIDNVEGPPELIIQDELHLISGPLGTMVGLYETAVHMLCSDGGAGPKIIASTATIRRAEQQIRKLYATGSFQFPPPGLDARDSYFAVEVPRESKGARRYLGLMAPGTSHATLLVRTYAALLQKAFELDGTDELRDPYWTLLGYFNSLRVLGGARMQVRDDVCDRIELLSTESGIDERLTSDGLELIEMTSRVDSSDIPANLDRMALSRGDTDCLDVILATNMISVGVDIDRLGLMAVMGQPQSSSEYIQATSRVGRRFPGLVVVLFNAARSRDRSHYEDFESFHASLYRQVDASSVTPFAARARDRALHAIFIGMLRARYTEFRDNKGASNVDQLDILAQPVIDQILARVTIVEPDEVDGTEASLRQLIKDWKWRASENSKLVFSNKGHPELALLADASRPEVAEEHESFSTMWSLRAVDTESNLFLVRD
jgi:hypothetical protein